MMGAGIPFGAEQRLLPEWIPLSFFFFALTCLPLGWTLLLFQAENISAFEGGFGPVLATLHTFTIGVVLSTAFGASMQMLPVATGATMNKPQGVVALLILLITGVVITLGGFAHYRAAIAGGGAVLLALSALLYTFLLVRLLLRSESLKLVRNHVLIGASCLFFAALLGGAMTLNWGNYIVLSITKPAQTHAGLAIYGFMGLIVFGFSRIMVPMLSVSDKTNDKQAFLCLIISLIALLAWVSGFQRFAPIIALIAALLHVSEMMQILKGRIRTRLGPEWLIIRFSWAMLILSLILAITAEWTNNAFNCVELTILVAVLGWLVSFIIGILQRIVPFLLSMQIARQVGMPELPSRLSAEKLATYIGPLHITAVALCALGVLFDITTLIRIGSLFGIASGVSFFIFLIIALKRKRKSLEKMKK